MAKILVVDDEIETLDMISAALEKEGYTVLTATTGTDTLRIVGDEQPDLTILDIMLPDIDGYFLMLEFAKDNEAKNMPIIVLSGLTPTKALFKEMPQVKSFIGKPFNTDELCKTVKKALAQGTKK